MRRSRRCRHALVGCPSPPGADSWKTDPSYLTSRQAMHDYAVLLTNLTNQWGAQDRCARTPPLRCSLGPAPRGARGGLQVAVIGPRPRSHIRIRAQRAAGCCCTERSLPGAASTLLPAPGTAAQSSRLGARTAACWPRGCGATTLTSSRAPSRRRRPWGSSLACRGSGRAPFGRCAPVRLVVPLAQRCASRRAGASNASSALLGRRARLDAANAEPPKRPKTRRKYRW